MNGGACQINSFGQQICTCPPSYTGQYCQTVISGCSSNPCMNGGTCCFNSGIVSCTCPQAYTGQFCQNCKLKDTEIKQKQLDLEYNLHNSHVLLFMSFALVASCTSNICSNGGTCYINSFGQQACYCTSLYTGVYCQTRKYSKLLHQLLHHLNSWNLEFDRELFINDYCHKKFLLS
jgi:hypothetical protein